MSDWEPGAVYSSRPASAEKIISKEAIEGVIKAYSSPTYDRGDAHGARGQRGYIIWENQIGFIAAAIAALRP